MKAVGLDVFRTLLSQNNLDCEEKDIQHGKQFRFGDGAICSIYDSGKVVWGGKDTESARRMKEALGVKLPVITPGDAAQPAPASSTYTKTNKVFIVYGHDAEAREQLELLLRRMKLEPVILQNLVAGGDTIIEKLEGNMDVKYACVLLTPDDEGHAVDSPKDTKPRARQNVVLEMGMFLAKLGRKRVAILHKGNLELPSDINGLLYVKFNKRVDEVKERLAAELQEAGYTIAIKDLLG